jgi:hypothetical protein
MDSWVIVHPGPPASYIKRFKGERPSMDITFQRYEAQRFTTEIEAEMEIVRLQLPRTWFAVRL